jgi:hypothetical protein
VSFKKAKLDQFNTSSFLVLAIDYQTIENVCHNSWWLGQRFFREFLHTNGARLGILKMLCYTGSAEIVLVVTLYWVFQYIRTDWTDEIFID